MQICYRSKFRLTRGSDQLTSGFWWFANAETPFYPGFHQLGSRSWTSGERDANEPLGEWSGERTFYAGKPPARRPLPLLVGDEDCIAHGDRPGLPIINDVSAACAKILPDACYGAEDELLAATNVLDCVFAKLSSDIINSAYDDLPAAAALAADLLPPAAVVTSFGQPNDLTPAGVIGVIGTTAVLWLTGTLNRDQLAVQALYAGNGPINFGLYSASGLYEAAALLMGAQLTAAGAGAALRVVLVGHSYGGAVCMVLAARMKIADPGRVVELLTLGASQPGDQRLIDIIFPCPQTHYVDARDPIPYMPPRGLTFAGFIPIIGPVIAAFWPRFARPTHVVVITTDGQLTEMLADELPTDLMLILSLAIAAAIAAPSFKFHRTDWYSYYLCKACSCVPRPCVAPEELDVGFNVAIDDFEYVFLGVPTVTNQPRVTLDVVERFPGGQPKTWATAVGFPNGLQITASVDGVGNYTAFELLFTPFPTSPLFACQWLFTADEVLASLATTTFPNFFSAPSLGDGVTSLGGLFIFAELV